MTTTVVTKPLMTDETGQSLAASLGRIYAMQGRSAYTIYKENTGYTGTEAEYAAMVAGNIEEAREARQYVEKVYNTFIRESIAPPLSELDNSVVFATPTLSML